MSEEKDIPLPTDGISDLFKDIKVISNEEYFQKLYETNTLNDIADKFKVCPKTLQRRFKTYNIKIKKRDASSNIPSKEYLSTLYEKERKSSSEIADILRVNKRIVIVWLKNYNIPIRPMCTSPKEMPSKELLYELYKTRTLKEVGYEFDVTEMQVQHWFKKYDIERKHCGSRERELPSKEHLSELYEKYTLKELSKILHATEKLIAQWLESYGIKRRRAIKRIGLFKGIKHSNELNNKFSIVRIGKDKFNILSSKEEMQKLYSKYHSHKKMAKIIGVSNPATLAWLKKHKIKIKDPHTSSYELLTKEFLIEHYINKKMTPNDIAKIVGSCGNTINYQLKKYGIKIRSISESQLIFHSRHPELKQKYRDISSKNLIKSGFHPNNSEKKLISLLEENKIPFKYVGNADLFIKNLNPDFVYEKLIIEVWGEYHHSPYCFPNIREDSINPNKRISIFEEQGYKTLVVLSQHIVLHPKQVVDRINKFVSSKTSGIYPENYDKYMRRASKNVRPVIS